MIDLKEEYLKKRNLECDSQVEQIYQRIAEIEGGTWIGKEIDLMRTIVEALDVLLSGKNKFKT